VVVIACEYSATATKGTTCIVVRPGTTPALALGFAHVILREKLYDVDYVKRGPTCPCSCAWTR
jgi:nitrate reductase alpha subunit